MTGYVLALDSIRGQFLPWRKLCVHVLHILLFGLLYLSLIIVLQLSRLVSPFTKGIFGRVESWTFFGTAQKMCLVSARKQVYYGLLDNACQAKVGQRTYKQLLVIIIILSLFSPLHDDDAEENWLCRAHQGLQIFGYSILVARRLMMTLWCYVLHVLCKNSRGDSMQGQVEHSWWEKMKGEFYFLDSLETVVMTLF